MLAMAKIHLPCTFMKNIFVKIMPFFISSTGIIRNLILESPVNLSSQYGTIKSNDHKTRCAHHFNLYCYNVKALYRDIIFMISKRKVVEKC